ncbi:MAG: Grx4 family monothiol glutaredoxin [SAR324 cluster bacterium]|nr:Grx4 family monothiol glutaredoxin [SAR324 cluster bacterium]
MGDIGKELRLTDATEANAQDVIKEQLANNDILIFIKGTDEFPECGYSSRAVQIMDLIGKSYKFVDVLKNEHIRQGIKVLSDWPTIPQVFYKNEFLGGCDILIEMFQTGELHKKLGATA